MTHRSKPLFHDPDTGVLVFYQMPLMCSCVREKLEMTEEEYFWLGSDALAHPAPQDRVLSPAATEPVVSAHSGDAPLRLAMDITPDLDANAAGELLLSYFNEQERWGYSTRDFLRGGFVEVEGQPSLKVRTQCCGCWANTPGEGDRVAWWHSDDLGLDVYLHWDGDGTIVIEHANWMLENGDCKKSNEWEWVDEDHWSADLPPNYYEDSADLAQKDAA